MKRFCSRLGRRQFLMGAASTSVLGLAGRTAAKVLGGNGRPGGMAGGMIAETAAASEKHRNPSRNSNGKKYGHLLSPLKVRNVIVKNRILYSVSTPHFIQGPENFPADVTREYFAGVARSAAIVTCRIEEDVLPRKYRSGDSAHMMIFDLADAGVQNYFAQMVEGIHSMGSLVCAESFWGGSPLLVKTGVSMEDIVVRAKKLEDMGVDMVYMGGTKLYREENARGLIEQMQAVRNATGLVIGMTIMVKEPSTRPETADLNVQHEYSLDEAAAIAGRFEGAADIMFIKASSGMTNHPTGFNQDRNDPVVLRISRFIKESGAGIITAPNGGFRDPESNDAFIASGQTDMVAMARTIIADPEYGLKAHEGRGEDIVPCIMCNKCHGLSMDGPWVSVCSVNPKLGLPSALRMLPVPKTKKTVAVIGGGPAGMQAAITAAERGHQVTLYEKNGFLGGLLRHTDFSSYKWPLKDFKDYLVRRIYKTGVEVRLNTAATPEAIREKGYDVVMAALGATPSVPRIPGADGGNVWDVMGAYENGKKLGKKIVFIGGGEYGVETAMHLAKSGHQVTVLTSSRELMPIERVHYPEIVMDTYEHLGGFSYVTDAIATGIADGKVAYTAGGDKKSIRADSVVIYAGLKANQSEALKFKDAAGQTFCVIGDCTGRGGDVQKCVRNAFFMASQI